MADQLQEILWPFITEYRRETGRELSYLDLMQDRSILRNALETAFASNNARLQQLAQQLQAALQTREQAQNSGRDSGRTSGKNVSGMPGQAPVSKASTTASAPVSGALNPAAPGPVAAGEIPAEAMQTVLRSASTADSGQSGGEAEYQQALERCLTGNTLRFQDRSQLDAIIDERSIRPSDAERIERNVRRDRGVAHLNWRAEMLAAALQMAAGKGLSPSDRLNLVHTYVERGRVSAADAESLFAEAGSAPSAQQTGLTPLAMGGIAAVLVALIALGITFFWPQEQQVQPVSVAQAQSKSSASRAPEIVTVVGSVTGNRTWRADSRYELEGIVFVERGASLTIEPGTKIYGKPGSALIVTKDAKIFARGSAAKPIVFSSAKPAGQRDRADWGGVVLLGNAPINRPGGQAQIEGIAQSDVRGRFGGRQPGDSCGTLEYVRIEFAGFEVFANNELNGLTLGGCGSDSIIRHVQVHKALDDGIEVFGGDVDLRNIVVTGAKDDSFDWDMGWRGRVQFLVIQQHSDAGDNGFEGDNYKKDNNAQPRSMPTFYNVTMIGSGTAKKAQRAMTLRRGTGAVMRNFVITGFRKESIDVRDKVSAALSTTGELTLENSIIHDIGLDGISYFSKEEGDKDDDGGFDEERYFRAAAQNNRFGIDPLLSPDYVSQLKPNFAPLRTSPTREQAATPPEAEFWDQAATFIGALRPGSRSDWTSGWTAYPAK